MIEACDHHRTKLTLSGFRAATKFVGIQDDGEGGILYLGQCRACHSTLAVQIDLVRGHVVAGEIETYRGGLRIDPPKPDGEPPF